MKRPILVIVVAVALVAGLGGGLLYAWVLAPGESYDASPDSLCLEARLVYLALIGDLYVQDGDLALAQARLAELGVEASGPILADLIEQYLHSGGQPEEVRNLAYLAEDLGASGGILLVFGSTPPALTPTPPTPIRPMASLTPPRAVTPTPGVHLLERTAVCADPGRAGTISVWVQDAQGEGLPGVEIVVSWALGQDRFFTGLRPEEGSGYADFEMTPGTSYQVALADWPGETADGLSSTLSPGRCPTGTLAVDWQLTFTFAGN